MNGAHESLTFKPKPAYGDDSDVCAKYEAEKTCFDWWRPAEPNNVFCSKCTTRSDFYRNLHPYFTYRIKPADRPFEKFLPMIEDSIDYDRLTRHKHAYAMLERYMGEADANKLYEAIREKNGEKVKEIFVRGLVDDKTKYFKFVLEAQPELADVCVQYIKDSDHPNQFEYLRTIHKVVPSAVPEITCPLYGFLKNLSNYCGFRNADVALLYLLLWDFDVNIYLYVELRKEMEDRVAY